MGRLQKSRLKMWATNFIPNTETLKLLHKELFQWTELDFAAGIWRTLPLKWGKTDFAPAYRVPELMEDIFQKERKTPEEILAWTIETIWYIHPFLDGNRRTCWMYTNMWLESLAYAPINWDVMKTLWERDIARWLSLDERLESLKNNLS